MSLTLMDLTWRIDDTEEANDRRSADPYRPTCCTWPKSSNAVPSKRAQWGDTNQQDNEARDLLHGPANPWQAARDDFESAPLTLRRVMKCRLQHLLS